MGMFLPHRRLIGIGRSSGITPSRPAVNAFSPVKAKLLTGQNVVIWVNGDSTAYSDFGPFYLWAVSLGNLYDATVIMRRWAEWEVSAATGPKTYADAVTLRSGSGPQISVYLAALPGGVPGTMWDASRRTAAIDPIPTPDLIIMHQGHNIQSFEILIPNVNQQGRGLLFGAIGMASMMWPNVPQIITTQNAWRDNSNFYKVYQAITEVAQALPSLTVVNTHDDFIRMNKAPHLYRDNIHPSDTSSNYAGAALIASRLMSDYAAAIPGAFTTVSWPHRSGANLMSNGDFTPWTATFPTSWSALANGTASKDTTNIYPGQGFAWSASVVPNIPTGNQNSGLVKGFNSTERNAIAGKTVSIAFLVKGVPTQRAPFVGFMVRAGGALRGLSIGGNLAGVRDGWNLLVASGIPVDLATATDANTGIRLQPGFGVSAPPTNDPMIVQRIVVVEGEVPAGLLL